jgi:hypothetical protein
MQDIIYIGLDVDDQSFHGSTVNKSTGETQDFQCHPTIKSLGKQLLKIQKLFPDSSLKICYEATYLGFSLQREIADLGFHCDVIPKRSKQEEKTKIQNSFTLPIDACDAL